VGVHFDYRFHPAASPYDGVFLSPDDFPINTSVATVSLPGGLSGWVKVIESVVVSDESSGVSREDVGANVEFFQVDGNWWEPIDSAEFGAATEKMILVTKRFAGETTTTWESAPGHRVPGSHVGFNQPAINPIFAPSPEQVSDYDDLGGE
jgi:hypothetical protein